MQPPTVTMRQKGYKIFLACLALVLMILGGIVTSRYGAGVAGDSVKYLSVADNILSGGGLYEHNGLPLLSWPPLYSILLACLSWATGWDVFIVGWYLNVLLLGVNLFLSGMLAGRIFLEKPLYAVLASAFVFLSISSLKIHAVISADPLYLTVTLWFLMLMNRYVEKRSPWVFAWMMFIGAFAPLLRYVGLVLTLSALVVIAIENRRSVRVILRDGFLLGMCSVVPIGWWLGVHNVMNHGSLWGIYHGGVTDVGQNISLALTKILHWFIPYLGFLMPILMRPFIPLGILLLLLFLLNRRNNVGEILKSRWVSIQPWYPILIHAVVYFLVVAWTSSTADHRYLYSDRYNVILLVPLAILGLFTFDWFVVPHCMAFSRRLDRMVLIVFVVWSVYPLYSIRNYVSDALRGEPGDYNIYNTRLYREMDIVIEAQKLAKAQPQAVFYSNYADMIWFHTRRDVFLLPESHVPDPVSVYSGWPHDRSGYIIWLDPFEFDFYLTPEQIADIADLELVYQSEHGRIFYVESR